MLFPMGHNGKCGGTRIAEFNAASEDSMTFLCSGSHRNLDETMGCHHAFDGIKKQDDASYNEWRPQCGAENGGCQAKEAWIGVHFPTPVFVGCMQVLGRNGSPSEGLGKGVYYGPETNPKPKPWNGGLAVEVSDDGELWQAVEIEAQECRGCNLNTALIVDGKP
jgi:hypothetical protein